METKSVKTRQTAENNPKYKICYLMKSIVWVTKMNYVMKDIYIYIYIYTHTHIYIERVI